MMRRLLLPLALATASFPAWAQLDTQTQERVDKALASWDQPGSAGGVVGVIKDGKLAYCKGFGEANLEFHIPFSRDTAMDIGSITKHFTATALLMLEDEGKLSLDDDIRKWVPSVPKYDKVITIRHLLTHTSGIRDYITCMALSGWQLDEPLREKDVLECISRQSALNFQPGTNWIYSNTGYFLAAQVVKKASGRPLAAFLSERIFKPLHMTAAHLYNDQSAIVPNRADSYSRAGSTWRRLTSPAEPAGDGGLLMTPEDFAKWDKALRTNELHLKAPGHLARLAQTGPLPTGYGLGLQTDKVGDVKRIGHGGNWLGFNSFYSLFPDKDLSLVVLCNDGTQNATLNSEAVAKALFNIADKPLGSGAEVAWTDEDFAKIEGVWLGGGLRIRIFEMSGQRQLQAAGQPAFPLYLKNDGTAFLKIVPLTLTTVKKGAKDAAEEMELVQQTAGGPVKLTLTRAPKFTPTAEALQKWEGRWWSPDLRTIFILRRSGTILFLSSTAGLRQETPLILLNEKSATLGPASLTYVDGDRPQIRLDAGRANGFLLERVR